MPEVQNSTQAGPMSERFLGFLIRQSQQIALCLGQIPGPSGQVEKHLDYARLLIDELEMIQEKTRNNLTREESQVLEGMLGDLRLAFVKATTEEAHQPAPATIKPEPAEPEQPQPAAASSAPAEPTPTEDDSKKRFSKSYG